MNTSIAGASTGTSSVMRKSVFEKRKLPIYSTSSAEYGVGDEHDHALPSSSSSSSSTTTTPWSRAVHSILGAVYPLASHHDRNKDTDKDTSTANTSFNETLRQQITRARHTVEGVFTQYNIQTQRMVDKMIHLEQTVLTPTYRALLPPDAPTSCSTTTTNQSSNTSTSTSTTTTTITTTTTHLSSILPGATYVVLASLASSILVNQFPKTPSSSSSSSALYRSGRWALPLVVTVGTFTYHFPRTATHWVHLSQDHLVKGWQWAAQQGRALLRDGTGTGTGTGAAKGGAAHGGGQKESKVLESGRGDAAALATNSDVKKT